MRINPALALPAVVAFVSLVTGVVVAPPTHLAQLSLSAESAAVDGGGPVDLSEPWDPAVTPGNTQALGPPVGDLNVIPVGTEATLPDTSSRVSAEQAVLAFGSASGIPSNVLLAYQHAAQLIATTDPSCHLQWWVLAGIGKVESGHARGGALDASGRTLSPILGPVLSGGPYAAIRDTDGGRWDGDTVWDRAVGPMQFIPSSWRSHAVDGNSDGIADPSNIYDSTLAAGGYLCTGQRDLSQPSALRQAIFGYNHSTAYVDTVLAWARAYASGGGLAIAPASGGGPVVLASGPTSSGSTASSPPPPRPSPTASAAPTVSASPTPTPSPSPSPTGTSPTGEPTSTGTPTQTPTQSPSPTGTPTPTETGCPTATPTPTGTEAPTASPSPTPTPTPTADPTATPSPTPTDPCATPTPTPTGTRSELPSPSPKR